MFRNRSVDVHQFAMVPRSDIPRSSFDCQQTLKTTFDAGFLVPILVDEMLPGDTFKCNLTAFTRLATPIFPIMDNLHMDTFFFFIPNRLVWNHWVNFMGEQANPFDSISYTIPQQVSPAGGYVVGSLQDYLGLPTVGQVAAGNTVSHSALWLRAYNLIWNSWFRDENLQNSLTVDLGDGPDANPTGNYVLQRRGKRFDYFTGCLPWPQKGASGVSLPLGTQAPVRGIYIANAGNNNQSVQSYWDNGGTQIPSGTWKWNTSDTGMIAVRSKLQNNTAGGATQYPDVYADLSQATAATINAIRLAFQTQKLLEHDARGGTRYTEIVRSHFGVISPDARLQRPEYLGGGSSPITVNPIAQTSGTSATGTTTPMGTLAAMGQGVARGHGFHYSATEHGLILGLVSVRADLTYQQGLHKMWSRLTRYDFYFPVFASLGEQAVLNKEIYCDGSANDSLVFGYQERWAEYRYMPSRITGLFKSTSSGAIDAWHLAQKFTSLPTLNTTFIQDNPPVSRVVAVGAAANGQQFLMDAFFDIKKARPMPLYSVPGLIDHF